MPLLVFIDSLPLMPIWIALIGLVGAALGAGGVSAFFKLGPERGQITVTAAQGAVVIHQNVLKDLNDRYDQLSDELAQMKMENMTLEQHHQQCRSQIGELQSSVLYLQKEQDRNSRLTLLARRKTHLAVHTIGAYDLLIENIFDDMREHKVPIKPELRPIAIRQAFQTKMEEIEELEARVMEEVVEPPTLEEIDRTAG